MVEISELEKEIQKRGTIETLDNGVTIIAENSLKGLATGNIRIQAGTAQAHKSGYPFGTAHALEHAVFGDSRGMTREERQTKAMIMGLNVNAGTALLQTLYPITGYSTPILKEKFLEALRTVHNMVFNPKLDISQFEHEKNVILDELNKKLSQPGYESALQIYAHKFANNPWMQLTFNGLGTRDTIQRITVEDLGFFHDQFYKGNNTLLTLQGDIDSTTLDHIKELAMQIEPGSKEPLIHVEEERPIVGTQIQTITNYTSGIRVCYQVPPSHTNEHIWTESTRRIMAGLNNNILWQELRDKKGMYGLDSSGIDGHNKTAYLDFSINVSRQRFGETIEAIESAATRMQNGDFDENYVEAVKKQVVAERLTCLQQPGWIVKELIERYEAQRSGYNSTMLQRLQEATKINKNGIMEFAQKYLNNKMVLLMVPQQ